MVITLIGYRGSGKSTIAAPLAARLGFRWVDADAQIDMASNVIGGSFFDDNPFVGVLPVHAATDGNGIDVAAQ